MELGRIMKTMGLIMFTIAVMAFTMKMIPLVFKNMHEITAKTSAEENKDKITNYTVDKEKGEVSVPIEKNGKTVYINIKVDNIENMDTMQIDEMVQSMNIDTIENVENFNIEGD